MLLEGIVSFKCRHARVHVSITNDKKKENSHEGRENKMYKLKRSVGWDTSNLV